MTKQQKIEAGYAKADNYRALANAADEKGQTDKAERLFEKADAVMLKVRELEGVEW